MSTEEWTLQAKGRMALMAAHLLGTPQSPTQFQVMPVVPVYASTAPPSCPPQACQTCSGSESDLLGLAWPERQPFLPPRLVLREVGKLAKGTQPPGSRLGFRAEAIDSGVLGPEARWLGLGPQDPPRIQGCKQLRNRGGLHGKAWREEEGRGREPKAPHASAGLTAFLKVAPQESAPAASLPALPQGPGVFPLPMRVVSAAYGLSKLESPRAHPGLL